MSKVAQSIGVSVREMTAESTTAIVSVRANSRNIRPTTPVINKRGINTAINETVNEITVKPISFAPLSAASKGDLPDSI